jgi:transposase
MSRRIDFTLTEEQLGELEEGINTSPYPEVRQRAIAVRLLHLGQHPEQVAQAVMVTSNTIYAWHKRGRARYRRTTFQSPNRSSSEGQSSLH